MAKCIQVVGQGVPVRMSDDDAFQVVERDHDGQYCSKFTWRAHWDSIAGGPRQIVKLVGNKISETRTLARHDQQGKHRYV